MDDSNILFFLMTALVGFLIGLSKGGLGGLLGSLATPLMSLVMPPEQVVGLLLPLLMFADVFAMFTYWKRWQARFVLLLLPGGNWKIISFFLTKFNSRRITSWIISGSKADVGSSKSMILGFMASARAMATRCCWPPESWMGKA